MAILTFRDYIFNDLGQPVGNIRVRPYTILSNGQRNNTPISGQEAFTSSLTGMWTLTIDSTTSPTGMFAFEITNTSTGQVRWRFGDIQLQASTLYGPHGNLPAGDASVTTGKIVDGAITSAKIAAADKQIVQDISNPMANTGTLGQIFSWFAKQIRLITGNADWKSSPLTNLATVAAHMSNTAIHSSSANTVLNAGSVTSIKYGSDTGKGSASSHAGQLYLASNGRIYYSAGGSSWILMGIN